MPRPNLRQGLDHDVYTVLKKLEGDDEGSLKTVGQVYDAIQGTNSHLKRQKKRPLEDSIDRVLQFRRQELQDSEDSEAAIEEEEETRFSNTGSGGFLLNRQMTKHWHTKPQPSPQPSPPTNSTAQPDERQAKRRRIQNQDQDVEDASKSTPSAVTNGNDQSMLARKPADPKRKVKPFRFRIENPPEVVKLGGVKDVEDEIRRNLQSVLLPGPVMSNSELPSLPGILLSGAVGVGKKSLVRSGAAQLGLPLIDITQCFSDAEKMEKLIVEATNEAINLAPCIIFLSQVHRYMAQPGTTASSDNHDRKFSLLSSERQRLMRELPKGTHVAIVGTTSEMTSISPDLFQDDGLFAKTIHVPVPDLAAREEIFRVIAERIHCSSTLDFAELARSTHGFVGFDIMNVVRSAGYLADTRHQTNGLFPGGAEDDTTAGTFTMDDIRASLEGYVPSLRTQGFTSIPDVTWNQVGALERAREQLNMSIVGPIKTPDVYDGYGLGHPAGIILWGPPGCGKTLLAQAVANEAKASFILINGPELLNKYVGESERAVRELFQRARSSKPCIIFFDEMDSLVPRREGSSSSSGVRVVNALLAELDGVNDRSGIYVIGTTNRPDMIDAAMLRPGRLSVSIFVDLPTEDERVSILRAIFKTRIPDPTDTELAILESVARDRRCKDFSGADLGGLQIKASESALRKRIAGLQTIRNIDRDDWEFALAHTTRSVTNPGEYRALEARHKQQSG